MQNVIINFINGYKNNVARIWHNLTPDEKQIIIARNSPVENYMFLSVAETQSFPTPEKYLNGITVISAIHFNSFIYLDLGQGTELPFLKEKIEGCTNEISKTYDLQDYLWISRINWYPTENISCIVKIDSVQAVTKNTKRKVQFSMQDITTNGKITPNGIEFQGGRPKISIVINGSYENFTIIATIRLMK